jgi:hypothetical protein
MREAWRWSKVQGGHITDIADYRHCSWVLGAASDVRIP